MSPFIEFIWNIVRAFGIYLAKVFGNKVKKIKTKRTRSKRSGDNDTESDEGVDTKWRYRRSDQRRRKGRKAGAELTKDKTSAGPASPVPERLVPTAPTVPMRETKPQIVKEEPKAEPLQSVPSNGFRIVEERTTDNTNSGPVNSSPERLIPTAPNIPMCETKPQEIKEEAKAEPLQTSVPSNEPRVAVERTREPVPEPVPQRILRQAPPIPYRSKEVYVPSYIS